VPKSVISTVAPSVLRLTDEGPPLLALTYGAGGYEYAASRAVLFERRERCN
jgi:hypothetical protein